MKKLLFVLLSFLLISGMNAQEDPGKALKKATRALGSYNLDQSANEGKLKEAVENIEVAAGDKSMQANIKMWQTRGEIFNTLAQKDINHMILDQDYTPVSPGAGKQAANSFLKAFDLAEKKYEKKDALKGMSESCRHLNVIGNFQIQKSDYTSAFQTFDKVLILHETLKANGEDSPISDDDYDNTRYITAYCAKVSENSDRAKVLFKKLYDEEFDEPGVYSQYFQLLKSEGDENALEVLEKGRSKYPDNAEILFTEINYYIALERFDVLEKKLKKAIEAEPENASVRSALGNVYMNLYQEEYDKNGMNETAQKYFDNSLDYFNQAIELNEKAFDAIYSIGSIYFNQAVDHIKKASQLGMSKEDQKEYERLDSQAKELMSIAKPYFIKAEKINPNDLNTLVALSEIFARSNDLEKSKIFKQRLETVKNGGSLESSYFNE